MSKFGRRAGPGSPSFIAVARACTMSARSSAKSLHPSLKSERLSLLRRVSLARYHSPRNPGNRFLLDQLLAALAPRRPIVATGHYICSKNSAFSARKTAQLFRAARRAAPPWPARWLKPVSTETVATASAGLGLHRYLER